MFKGQKCPVWRSWNMSCSIVSSYSTKIHDTNLLGNRTWSLEICQNPSIGFEGKASINRKLIVYTIELLEGKSLTIMFRASVPLLVAPRCIKPHFCCRLVGWLSTQKKGTTLETTTSSLVYPLVNKHSYGKSPFLMVKSAINGHFQ
jgi:hypothetical protein